jgi:type III restriction enzyme
LRQPYAYKHLRKLLDASYVITASAKFSETLDVIVNGLNRAGFSSRDYKVAENALENAKEEQSVFVQMELEANEVKSSNVIGDQIMDTDTISIVEQNTNIITGQNNEVDEVISKIEIQAIEQEQIFNNK